MSMPSDTTPDVMDATREMEAADEKGQSHKSQLTREQGGMVIAALVAFLGITYFGPALTRFRRAPTARERVAYRLREARRQARKAGGKVRKQVRQLGSGKVWR